MRKTALIALVLAACTTPDPPPAPQPLPAASIPPLIVTDSTLTGKGSVANPLSVVGGATAVLANNAVPRSNGAHLVASDISDNLVTVDFTNGGALCTVAVASGNLTCAAAAFASTATTVEGNSSTSSTNERVRFSGHDWQANTSTNGPAFVLGVNATNDRRLWLVDSGNETKNTTNSALQITVSAAVGTGIGAISTDGSTQLPLAVQNGGGPTNVGGPLNVAGRSVLTGQYTYVGRQPLTAASATYNPTTGVRGAIVWMCGAGGGGGGAKASAGVVSVSGGGASGTCIMFRVGFAGSTITGGAYTNDTVGGSAGVGATPAAGGTGGDATLTIAGSSYTAKGGTGGGAGNQGGTVGVAGGGVLQAGTTSTSIDATVGNVGAQGWIYQTTGGGIGNNGANVGGGCPFGVGGGTGLGANATGKCAGGGGVQAVNASVNGGTGAPSFSMVDEYI